MSDAKTVLEQSGGPPSDPGAGKCAICGRPRKAEYRPFCSQRCRTIDLSRWMTGAYAVAGDAQEDEEPN